MPVTFKPESTVSLPSGESVIVTVDQIKQDVHVTVVCDDQECKQSISWSQAEVAAHPGALPEQAKGIMNVSTFDGKTHVFCSMDCLVDFLTRVENDKHAGIKMVK
jgi:hypothetical protein